MWDFLIAKRVALVMHFSFVRLESLLIVVTCYIETDYEACTFSQKKAQKTSPSVAEDLSMYTNWYYTSPHASSDRLFICKRKRT